MENKLDLENISLQPVLGQEFGDAILETAQVNDRQLISQLVDELNKSLPIPSLSHLKRINSQKGKYLALICLDTHDELILSAKDAICKQFELCDHAVMSVPSKPPLTRTQYQKCSQLWPTNFHPNKYIEKCLSGKVFDETEKKSILENMQEVIKLKCLSNSSMSALIVDDDNHVVADGVSHVIEHPIQHAVMMAIDKVASSQHEGGGIWHKSHSVSHINQQNNGQISILPYLCTGYKIFVSQEPCLMCCMALVHSRIKKLFFFDIPDDQKCSKCCDKSLTVNKMHTIRSLNHHYEVWKVKMS